MVHLAMKLAHIILWEKRRYKFMIEEEKYIQFEKLKDKDEIIHYFTKKPLDFNRKKIDENFIKSEYEEMQKLLNYECKKIIMPGQNHTNTVKIVDENNLDDKFENTDGLITNLKNIALITSLADCQGILLYDSHNKVIGNIHSGWKGTLKRIIYEAIILMIKEYNSNPKNIEVYFCPSILQCCFEVDEDVKNEFLEKFSDINIENYISIGKITNNEQKYNIDTVGINVEVIKKLGIEEKNIYTSNICTKCNNNIFHSHRGDKETDGRNIAFIMMK